MSGAPAAMRGAVASLWLGPAVNGALIVWAWRAGDDRTAAIAAAGSLLAALWTGLGALRLSPLAPPMVYLYVLAVFHLGLAAPWAFGVAVEPLPSWLIERRIAPALLLVAAALAAFQVGLALAGRRRPRADDAGPLLHNTWMYRAGVLVALVGVASLVWGARSLGFDRLLHANYFETYRLARLYDPRFFVTGLQVAPMGLYLAAAAAPVRRLPRVLALGGLWATAVFLLGFRGFALTPLVVLAAVAAKRGFRPPKWVWAAGLALLLAAIPAVRGFRADPLGERSLGELFAPGHPLEALQEMGGSLRPLVHTIELLDNEPLRWGRTYWQALVGVVPNVSLEWQGDRYIPLEELPPSHWVSKLAAPWSYRHYGGLGFSTVAEPYMNFGVPGVLVYFVLLGWALGRVDAIDPRNPTATALWAVVLGPLLWTTRNTAAVFLRPAAWGVAAVLGVRLMARSLAGMQAGDWAGRAAPPPGLSAPPQRTPAGVRGNL